MDFQKIYKIEKAQTYLDMALKAGREKAAKERRAVRGNDRLRKSIVAESARTRAIGNALSRRLAKIVTNFPGINYMSKFYQALFDASMDVGDLRKSLSSVNWASKKAREMGDEYAKRIRNATHENRIKILSKEFMGRLSSVMKRLDKDLGFIESCRKISRTFPDVKDDKRTIIIYGFPNVGKTTLLAKFTGSKGEIAAYAFTTKGINAGNITLNGEEFQVFDTPGTLARPDKMNNVERIAQIALKHLADAIVYVFDPTEPYPMKDQQRLYKTLSSMKKPIVRYVSKADLKQSDIKGEKDMDSLKAALERSLKEP